MCRGFVAPLPARLRCTLLPCVAALKHKNSAPSKQGENKKKRSLEVDVYEGKGLRAAGLLLQAGHCTVAAGGGLVSKRHGNRCAEGCNHAARVRGGRQCGQLDRLRHTAPGMQNVSM